VRAQDLRIMALGAWLASFAGRGLVAWISDWHLGIVAGVAILAFSFADRLTTRKPPSNVPNRREQSETI
jgi:hypothetical protein